MALRSIAHIPVERRCLWALGSVTPPRDESGKEPKMAFVQFTILLILIFAFIVAASAVNAL